MSVPLQIVVSTENSQYMAWQTQLFCFSARPWLHYSPVVIVHRGNEPLRDEYRSLRDDFGARLIEAPSFTITPKGEQYPPRNELGSLLIASSLKYEAQHILFCEADMLFVGPMVYASHLAGDYYYYLDYCQSRIEVVAQKFRLRLPLTTFNKTSQIGVPYLIPVRLLKRIAARWIEVLDAFEVLEWIDIMYAFGLALAIEKLEAATTHMVDHNYRPMGALAGNLIHYCYAGHSWDKRSYKESSPFDAPDETLPTAPRGTVLGEMIAQIREAREYFRPAKREQSASLEQATCQS